MCGNPKAIGQDAVGRLYRNHNCPRGPMWQDFSGTAQAKIRIMERHLWKQRSPRGCHDSSGLEMTELEPQSFGIDDGHSTTEIVLIANNCELSTSRLEFQLGGKMWAYRETKTLILILMLRGSLSTPRHRCREPNARTDQRNTATACAWRQSGSKGARDPLPAHATRELIHPNECRKNAALIRRADQQLDNQGVTMKMGLPICSGVQGGALRWETCKPVPYLKGTYWQPKRRNEPQSSSIQKTKKIPLAFAIQPLLCSCLYCSDSESARKKDNSPTGHLFIKPSSTAPFLSLSSIQSRSMESQQLLGSPREIPTRR